MNTEPILPQDKVILGPTEAKFIKLPPVNQLVDLLPAGVYRFVARETLQGMDYSLEYADIPSMGKIMIGMI